MSAGKGAVIAVALLVTTCAASVAQVQVPPLLRVHTAITNIVMQIPIEEDADLFIDANGHALETRSAATPFLSWHYQTGEGMGQAADLVRLRSALASAHVGLLQGRCKTQYDPIELGTLELTWYGRGTRRSVIIVDFDVDSEYPQCSAELVDLLMVIDLYAVDANVP